MSLNMAITTHGHSVQSVNVCCQFRLTCYKLSSLTRCIHQSHEHIRLAANFFN